MLADIVFHVARITFLPETTMTYVLKTFVRCSLQIRGGGGGGVGVEHICLLLVCLFFGGWGGDRETTDGDKNLTIVKGFRGLQ